MDDLVLAYSVMLGVFLAFPVLFLAMHLAGYITRD